MWQFKNREEIKMLENKKFAWCEGSASTNSKVIWYRFPGNPKRKVLFSLFLDDRRDKSHKEEDKISF